MDVIAERGIAAHYSGRVFVGGLIGRATSGGSSRGKTGCLNNANIALRVLHLLSFLNYDSQQSSLKGFRINHSKFILFAPD